MPEKVKKKKKVNPCAQLRKRFFQRYLLVFVEWGDIIFYFITTFKFPLKIYNNNALNQNSHRSGTQKECTHFFQENQSIESSPKTATFPKFHL